MVDVDIDAKAAAINEYGKLMLQHKVRSTSTRNAAPAHPVGQVDQSVLPLAWL